MKFSVLKKLFGDFLTFKRLQNGRDFKLKTDEIPGISSGKSLSPCITER